MENTLPRSSKRACLLNLQRLGFAPNFVVDIGANRGTMELYEVFPQSQHILVEPLVECEPDLARICQQLPNAIYLIAGAASRSGSCTIWAAPESDRSEIIDAGGTIPAGAEKRTMNAITVDELIEIRGLAEPGLIKIDVDGRECDVLEGMKKTFQKFECIVIEVALFHAPFEILAIMEKNDFALFDILEPLYRPADAALWQVDMVFVKKQGQFRQSHAWG